MKVLRGSRVRFDDLKMRVSGDVAQKSGPALAVPAIGDADRGGVTGGEEAR